jgi:hypothetical protein
MQLARGEVVFQLSTLNPEAVEFDLAVHSTSYSDRHGRLEDCKVSRSIGTPGSWYPVRLNGCDEGSHCLCNIVQVSVCHAMICNYSPSVPHGSSQLTFAGICDPEPSTNGLTDV